MVSFVVLDVTAWRGVNSQFRTPETKGPQMESWLSHRNLS
jgi:hypothetical protein